MANAEASARAGVITLLTDYGTRDAYVAAMKGAILSIHPQVRIVDITHEVPRHDVAAGAFLLKTAWRAFPPGTIHVAVVDPDVGGERLPILLSAGGCYFIGPDNGLFSWVLREANVGDCRTLAAPRFRREPVSATFHGRDIFGPAAAWLARGAPVADFGERVRPMELQLPHSAIGPGRIVTGVAHVDHFGNCLLAVTRDDIERVLGAVPETLEARVRGRPILGLRRSYEGAAPGSLFFLFGSSDHLEIAAEGASAAEATGLTRGERVEILFARAEASC